MSTRQKPTKADPDLLLLVNASCWGEGERGNPVLFAFRVHGAHCVGELAIDINR
jgi:hypothetical protein